MWAAVVVRDGGLSGVDVLVRVVVSAWVLYPVSDVRVKGFLMVWDAVGLAVGGMADLLAPYDYKFLMGDEPVLHWCGA